MGKYCTGWLWKFESWVNGKREGWPGGFGYWMRMGMQMGTSGYVR